MMGPACLQPKEERQLTSACLTGAQGHVQLCSDRAAISPAGERNCQFRNILYLETNAPGGRLAALPSVVSGSEGHASRIPLLDHSLSGSEAKHSILWELTQEESFCELLLLGIETTSASVPIHSHILTQDHLRGNTLRAAWWWRWSRRVQEMREDGVWAPWTVAHQAPPSMGFSRQEYWSGRLERRAHSLASPRDEA